MACRTLYDVKRVGYQAVAAANYMDAIGATPAVQELLAQGDIVIDTKGELATYKMLNGTKYVDDTNAVVRQTGSIKFTRNFDASMFSTAHQDLMNAGFGEYLSTGTAESTSIIQSGKGGPLSGADEFVFKSGSAVPVVGQLIHIPNYGVRLVTEVSGSNVSVDRPIDTAISSDTTINILRTFKMHNPKGTCDKSFNVIVENHQGSNASKEYIIAMGCNVMIEFNIVFEKQLTIAITFTSPDISLSTSGVTPVWTSEVLQNPWICNFTESIYIDASNAETPYFPQMIELGRSLAEEPLKYPGGRNNIRGYLNRVSIKPVFKLDIDTTGKLIRTAALTRSIVAWSFKQSQFAMYFPTCQGGAVDHTTNNSNHDAASVAYDVNHTTSGVYFGLCKY